MIEVIKSKIEGRGIITTVDINKDGFVGYIKGPVKHKINHSVKDSKEHPDWVGFKKNYWVDPQPPFKYINHSCEPNCGLTGTKTFRALRKIKAGEELTFDYSTSEVDTNWILDYECRCGSKTCRKQIRSIQSLSKKKINGYLPHIPTHYKKLLGL